MKSSIHLLLVFVLILIKTTSSQSIIKTLPGYPDPLPFKLETGYISVGENDEKQLFYYFIESERDPETDPLLFWLTGGPGCSGLSGLIFEIGPLTFDLATFDGSFPSLIINPYSWTKVASIIFIDAPIGTGFSYSNTSEGYLGSDTISTNDNYLFLRKWLLKHPTFLKNRLYVAGDSQGGKIAPMVALEIAKGNEVGLQPRMLLQGYIIGNSATDSNRDNNEKIPYAHRMALISDEYFEEKSSLVLFNEPYDIMINHGKMTGVMLEIVGPNEFCLATEMTILPFPKLAKGGCRGEYVNPEPNNRECLHALRLVNECTDHINVPHILEPVCEFMSPRPNDLLSDPLFQDDDLVDFLSLPNEERSWCRSHNYITIYIWANNETVQEALHIRKGTVTDWKRCNRSLSYEHDVRSVFKHHQLLNEKGFQTLAYSGDHDMGVPYMSTLKWIRNLNLTVDDEWRPWYVGGQVAGYTEKYKNNQAFITFATVKGAGHTAPEYNPKECLAMIDRWLSLFPL